MGVITRKKRRRTKHTDSTGSGHQQHRTGPEAGGESQMIACTGRKHTDQDRSIDAAATPSVLRSDQVRSDGHCTHARS
jgi:hypothetical protein